MTEGEHEVIPQEYTAPPALLRPKDMFEAFCDLVGEKEVNVDLVRGLIEQKKITSEMFNFLIKNNLLSPTIVDQLITLQVILLKRAGEFTFAEDHAEKVRRVIGNFLKFSDGRSQISTLKLKTLMREKALTEEDFNLLVKTGNISKQNVADLIKGEDIEWNEQVGGYVIIEELTSEIEDNPTDKSLATHEVSTDLRNKPKRPDEGLAKTLPHIRPPK